MKQEVLRMENVITEDVEYTNLNNFCFSIFRGEIMGLICMNEYGKRKLIEIITRNTSIKFGRIYFENNLVNSYMSSNGTLNRVCVIEQKSKLIQDLTVADNIFVLRRGFKKYWINKKVLGAQVMKLMEEFEVSIPPESHIIDLSAYQRCVVELFRAIIQRAALIIINDLSNILSVLDLDKFYKLLRKCVEQGISILYIGNHHEEVFQICDRVSLMQNGRIIKLLDKLNMTNKVISKYTISFEDSFDKLDKEKEEGILQLSNVETTYMKDISFSVQKGEGIVIFDKDNLIFSDILDVMQGNIQVSSGTILLNHQILSKKDIRQAFGDKIAIIGEDILRSMLFYHASYIDNLCFLLDKKLKKSKITRRVKRSIQLEYEKIVGSEVYEDNIMSLDKTALYNLVYYRIHLLNPKVVLCVQPFSGADMYLRKHIADLIRSLKRKGIAVIILAVNISDNFMVADRLLMVENGQIIREYLSEEFDQWT